MRMKILFLVPFLSLSMFCMGADSENHYGAVMPGGVNFSPAWQAWDVIQKEFVNPNSLDNQKIVAGMIRGMLAGTGDTHCSFFSKDEFDKFLEARKEGSVTAEVFRVKRGRGAFFAVGYLRIKGFYEKTAEEVIEASVEFRKNGVQGIVLDPLVSN